MKKIILVLVVFLPIHFIHAQPFALLTYNDYHNPSLILCDFRNDDGQYVYGIYGFDFLEYPFQYGTFQDSFAPHELYSSGWSYVFLNDILAADGYFETGSWSTLAYASQKWYWRDGQSYYGGLRGMQSTFGELGYQLVGSPTFDSVRAQVSLIRYDLQNESIEPLFAASHSTSSFFENDFPQYLRQGFGTYALPIDPIRLNDNKALFSFPRMGTQSVNGVELPFGEYLGYYLARIDLGTGEITSYEVSSPDGAVVVYALHESTDPEGYYTNKMLRGEAPIFDTGGNVYENQDTDSTFIALLSREDANGVSVWTRELYSYTHYIGQNANQNTGVELTRNTGSLIEMEGHLFYEEYLDYSLREGDTLYHRDFFGLDTTISEMNIFPGNNPNSIPQRVGFGRSSVYKLNNADGQPEGILQMEGEHILREFSYNTGLEASSLLTEQNPDIYRLGDSLAWTVGFYSAVDSVLNFKTRYADGSSQTYPLSISAGYNALILWVNSNLQITSHWNIPVALGDYFPSRGVIINSVSGYGSDSILIAATIGPSVSTSMDPSGMSEIVDYPQNRSCFLGIYGTPISTNLKGFDENELGFSIFPNPASSHLNITDIVLDGAAEYHIFDIAGRVVDSGYLGGHEPSFQIETSTLNPGHYIVELKDGSSLGRRKFVIL